MAILYSTDKPKRKEIYSATTKEIKMGIFAKPKTQYVTQEVEKANEEQKETAKAKSRLLETEGQNKGTQLQASQGQSIRKIFGN